MKYLKLTFVLILRNIRWLMMRIKKRGVTFKAKVNDYQMLLNLKGIGIDLKENNILKQLALDGIREEAATKIMKEFIKPRDVILEAGANIGYYTLLEAKIMKGKGKIFAIEPELKNFESLKKNIALNGFEKMVERKQLAFSDKMGHLKFYVTKESNLHSCIKPKGEYKTISVKTDTIDNFTKNKKAKINFIRMDIEGYECKVIKKMKSFLKQAGPLKLFIELHPHLVKTKEMVNLLKDLKKNGFEVYKVISRDTFIRRCLGDSTIEDIKIKDLIKDERVLKNICALETFFYKN
jgi:FkbM family methyltransferase